jgi:hypothetical protein
LTYIASESAFAAWAPDGVFWSEWAKPIAFIQAGPTIVTEPAAEATAPEVPGPLDPSSVVIVDLPGADAVNAGLALAERGFRPVPLFNGTSGPSAVIDVSPITRALGSGVERLERVSLGAEAAPAFLLDSRRSGGGADPRPGSYDNRWIVLPQDFPSGALLASRGFRTATLIQKDTLAIPPDLAHALRRWQDNGIQIRVVDVAKGQGAANVTVPKPSGFKLAWYAAIALLGLRRSNVGGFGSTMPQASQHGGFHG